MLRLISLLALLTGCGHRTYIEPELASAVSEFMSMCHKYKNIECLQRFDAGISIGIAATNSLDDDNRVVGVCRVDTNYRLWRSKVLIDEELVQFGGMRLKVIVAHELGHCLLGLEHADTFGTIMYPDIGSVSLEADWDKLIEQLFRKGK